MGSRILLGPPKYEELMDRGVHRLAAVGYDIVPSLHDRLMDHTHLSEYAAQCVGVIAGPETWGEEEFDLLPDLRVLVKCGVGIDNIDLDAARARGIRVCNSPGLNSNAVAEFCVGLMICLLRSVHIANKAMDRGERLLLPGQELKDRTVGLVGFGNIGRLVARKLEGFEVRLLAYDPIVSSGSGSVVFTDSLQDLIEESDIVSLHLPAIEENIEIFDKQMFMRFREGAYLINTSRGSLIDEDALVWALSEGRLAGAALDVLKDERQGAQSPLYGHPKVLLTPHLGAETREAYFRVGNANAEDMITLLQGGSSPRQII